MLTIESYYHHSQAGRGALATALLRQVVTPELIDAETPLRKIPEKLGIKNIELLKNETTDVKFDLVVKHSQRLVLGEVKMKVYSGCTAGRVEMMRKFKKVSEVLLDNKYENFSSALQQAHVRELFMVGAILYDTTGKLATAESDREWFCYTGLESGFREIADFLKDKDVQFQQHDDVSPYRIQFDITQPPLAVHILIAYGDEAIKALLGDTIGDGIAQFDTVLKQYQFEDLWLAQIIAINERARLQMCASQGTSPINLLIFILQNPDALTAITTFASDRRRETLSGAVSTVKSLTLNKSPQLLQTDLRLPQLFLASLGDSYTIDQYIADIIQLLANKDVRVLLQKSLIDTPLNHSE